MKMEKLAEYHGAISRSRGEQLLAAAGRDGSYLIRDSETLLGTYCICVLRGQSVYTYRLQQVDGQFWKAQTACGVKERLFRNVKNLILEFHKPDQGIAMPLLYPVITDLQQEPAPSAEALDTPNT